jgi:Methylase involved in ubiquinone/menaquinone biosynthesis
VQDDATRAHYDRLAEAYDENWAYSPAFIAWMIKCIVERLGIEPDDTVLDLGSGTGLYARELAEHARLVVCVDPSARMLAQIPSDERLVPVQVGAEDVASGSVTLPTAAYDVMLLKEVIHHVQDQGRVINGLTRLLKPRGRILVVMLPTTIAYPLFGEALKLFEERQPDPADIASAMVDAGLDATVTYEEFGLRFTTERYLGMLRSRYMSLLSSFDDDALEAGIAEIRREHPGPYVEFPDRFAFVLGVAG